MKPEDYVVRRCSRRPLPAPAFDDAYDGIASIIIAMREGRSLKG